MSKKESKIEAPKNNDLINYYEYQIIREKTDMLLHKRSISILFELSYWFAKHTNILVNTLLKNTQFRNTFLDLIKTNKKTGTN